VIAAASAAGQLRPPRSSAKVALILFAAAFVLYVTPGRFHGGGDATPAELLPIAVLHGHGFDLSEFAERNGTIPYYFSYRSGRILSSYPVLPGLLNVPVFAAARVFHVDLVDRRRRLSLLTSAGITAASVAFLFLALERLTDSRRQAMAFSALYAFGTNAWSNGAVSIMQHGPSLFFLTGALAALLARRNRLVPLAGLCLGFAVANRPTNLAFALPLALFVLLERRRSFPAFAALAAIPAALLFAYSETYWGSWRWLGQAQGGWGFDGDPGRTLPGLLVSPSRGLFVFTPFFVFAFLNGFLLFVRRGASVLLRCLFAGCLLLLGVYAFWGAWWGGESFSYRLLTEMSPALVLVTADGWRRWIGATALRRAAFAVAAGFSVVVQFLGVTGFPSKFNEGIDQETRRLWDWKRSELIFSGANFLRHVHLRKNELIVEHRPTPPAPEGWFEEPAEGDTIRGSTVRGSGWAACADGIARIEVLLDSHDVGSATYRQFRPAVRRVKPDVECGDFCGFRYRIDGVRPGRHTIQTRFFGRQGGTTSPPAVTIRVGS
jgi:hypothetical protein